ncbi:sensor histidine kinase [Arthrobacter sp. HY1533]|uniref:sensor histidine kinase n=1 Tax=Arthrobacter sp. HY1533 TaxID=2970919 RepID=UPI0022B9E31A|nr:histidine kinase [Arthrobacter sp. HY1533]
MNTKTTPVGSVWRTALLVVVVAAADFLLSLISLGLGLDSGTVPAEPGAVEFIRYAGLPVLAPLGAVALIWRNRFPRSVAAAAAIVGALTFSGIAFLVALYLLARRQLSWWVAGLIALCLGAEALVGIEPLGWAEALLGVVLLAAIAGWGAYRGQRVRDREARLASLRERAELAELERAAAVENSRLAERHRIAREMHDTLAHRMSLVAVQAAALQVDAPDTETANSARLIRETAHAALGELRDVLGVLHEDGTATDAGWKPVERHGTGSADSGGRIRTAPSGIAQIPGLLEEWRQAGVAVDFTPIPELEAGLSDAVSRAAFRVVQEGITNVARHAPDAQAKVGLEIIARQLHITVSNGPGDPAGAAVGAGLGLVGLAERVQLLGGTLSHGRAGNGFQLCARIPISGHGPDLLDSADGAPE